MSGFVFSTQGRQDMLDIWNYISQSSDMDSADRVRDTIFNAISRLVMMPGMGHKRIELASEPLRVWPVSGYLIVYRPDTDPLEVARVVSGYRDLSILFGE